MSDEDATSPDGLADWERLATEAVGDVIEFWGFKHNHGRLWALLFVRGEAMTGRQIRESLGLSKGAISMLTNDLRDWGILRRSRPPGSRAVHYAAEDDFLGMIRRVIRDRELTLVEEVRTTLDDAILAAETGEADAETLERLRRMYRLATMVKNAVELFLSSARLDVTDADAVLEPDGQSRHD